MSEKSLKELREDIRRRLRQGAPALTWDEYGMKAKITLTPPEPEPKPAQQKPGACPCALKINDLIFDCVEKEWHIGLHAAKDAYATAGKVWFSGSGTMYLDAFASHQVGRGECITHSAIPEPKPEPAPCDPWQEHLRQERAIAADMVKHDKCATMVLRADCVWETPDEYEARRMWRESRWPAFSATGMGGLMCSTFWRR